MPVSSHAQRADPFAREAVATRAPYRVSAHRNRGSEVEGVILQSSRPLHVYLLSLAPDGAVALVPWDRLPSPEGEADRWQWRAERDVDYFLAGSPQPIPELEDALVGGGASLRGWRDRLMTAPPLGATMEAHTSSWIRRL
jgi:hypothetical protein